MHANALPIPLFIMLAMAAVALVLVIKLAIDHILARSQRRIWAHERAEAERAARAQAEKRARLAAFHRAYPRRTAADKPVGPGLRPHPIHGPTHANASTPSWVVPPEQIHECTDAAPGIGDTGTPTAYSTGD